jgi:hypothetical protein
MFGGLPVENENELKNGEEIADPQSGIWLITRTDGTVLGVPPPNMGTLTEEEALAYAKEKYKDIPGVEIKKHYTSTVTIEEAKEF